VTITVATAPPRTAIPDVTGRSQDTATTTLSGAGFRVRVEQVSVTSGDDDGIVQSQTPGAGTQRSDGSTVTIRVGRKAEQRDADPTDSGSNGGVGASTTTNPGGATVPQTTPTTPIQDGP
jgi:beta-lactam-binding protein with PASTA domain